MKNNITDMAYAQGRINDPYIEPIVLYFKDYIR